MEEHRFDSLTRTLGMARSRRQVVKGLLAGIGAALVGRVAEPEIAVAAGTCSSAQVKTCYDQAKQRRDATVSALCSGQREGRAGTAAGKLVDSICTIEADRIYFQALAKCDHAQCAGGGTCINDRCCTGDSCCDPGVQCGGNSAFEPPTFCCPEGSSCCNDQCCGAGQTCCQHSSPGLPFGLRSPSFNFTCSDLSDDPKNCGACDNVCRGEQICQNGACTCPSGTSTCAGPFNVACCAPNEYCQSSAFGGVECVPKCSPCQVYDPNDPIQHCKPLECDTCQECDAETGQCVPLANGTECGSGLSCCGGQCVDQTCQGAQTFNTQTCQCECPQQSCPGNSQPNPTTCECDCSQTTCGPDRHRDPTTCQCLCSDTPPDSCRGSNMIWHPETCHCEIDCGPTGCGG